MTAVHDGVDRVLVAEADEHLRAVCASVLTFPGREVVAVSPRDAAARLDAEAWDALVLGWSGGPGEAYAMALATGLPPATRPAVVLLARDVSGPALRAVFRAGATDVVGVPVDLEHLGATVLHAMDEVLTARPAPVSEPPAPEPPPEPPRLSLFERLRQETAVPEPDDPAPAQGPTARHDPEDPTP